MKRPAPHDDPQTNASKKHRTILASSDKKRFVDERRTRIITNQKKFLNTCLDWRCRFFDCGQQFTNKQEFLEHYFATHKIIVIPTGLSFFFCFGLYFPDPPLTCASCPQRFWSRSFHRQHVCAAWDDKYVIDFEGLDSTENICKSYLLRLGIK